MDICEAEIPAGVAVGQTFMVNTEKVQHRRMKVMDMNLVDGGVVTELVGLTVGESTLYTAPAIHMVNPWGL